MGIFLCAIEWPCNQLLIEQQHRLVNQFALSPPIEREYVIRPVYFLLWKERKKEISTVVNLVWMINIFYMTWNNILFLFISQCLWVYVHDNSYKIMSWKYYVYLFCFLLWLMNNLIWHVKYGILFKRMKITQLIFDIRRFSEIF
jgi:hypothetical protein